MQQLLQLFSEGHRLVYQKDDIIIRPGDTPSGVYLIVSGWIKVYSLCKDGESNIIMTQYGGEVFPLAWAVRGTMQNVGFAALGTTEVQRIPLEHFLKGLGDNSAVMKDAVQALAQQFFTLTTELDNLQYRTAREKVVFRLLFLASRLGHRNRPGDDTVIIKARVTNDYIARSTSITRETASRELSRLYRRKLIRQSDGRLTIPSPSDLRNEISRSFNPQTLTLE